MGKIYGDVKPGDRFFRAQNNYRSGQPPITDWVVVSKVGRKWAEFHPEGAKPERWNMGRFDLEDGHLDRAHGYGGHVCVDEGGWRALQEARLAWRSFLNSIAHKSLPPGVTAADILAAAELLKLDMGK